jgi:predicted flap endonuclease-1-like 5' DNA nuclease
MPQSPRYLLAVSLLVGALFLAMNAAVRGAALSGWGLPLGLFVLGAGVAVWSWLEQRTSRWALAEGTAPLSETGVRVWEVRDQRGEQRTTPVDKPAVPLEAIVEPRPAVEAVDSDTLPPETSILEHVQTEPRPAAEVKPAIAIVDVEPISNSPTMPPSVVDIEAAAEAVAADIKGNADQIQAMLKSEADETGPVARDVASAEAHFADTQERSDSIASWVGEDDLAQAPADPGENINLSAEPNPVVEGLPKSGQTEFSGMAETAALENEHHTPTTEPDDLTMIEGIGHKMAAALVAAGIDSFPKLANAPADHLRASLRAAGIRLAPTLPTWSEQAGYAHRGDWDGLKTFQQGLSTRRRRPQRERS